MANQTQNGKAFEYSILLEFYNRLNQFTSISIVENEPYETAKKFFETFDEKEQDTYRLNASAGVNFLIDIEPRLSHGIGAEDVLQLEIASDRRGQSGDVRDVLFIRSLQKWEIGISAKNNHRALKHSRLSHKLDFGNSWVGMPCSEAYFNEVIPIFNEFASIRKENKNAKWDDFYTNKFEEIYVPILEAFKREIVALQNRDEDNFAKILMSYLIGNDDFYKLIKSKKTLEILAFNINGTLNKAFQDIKPKATVPIVKLPTRLIEIVFARGRRNTLLAYFDEGWQISLRLHTASSRVESSMKFDINLISTPHTLFVNQILHR